MGTKPWTSGPRELLLHAVEHMRADTPFDHRIALISVDNAAELVIKTYLGLPKRARGTDGPSRRELDQASSFPDLLDLLEKHAGSVLEGIHLDDLEWYHRLRNTLYHEGNGITVEPEKVDAYVQISKVLLHNLLGEDIDDPAVARPTTDLGGFVSSWASLEHSLRTLAERDAPEVDSDTSSFSQLIEGMHEHAALDDRLRNELATLWSTRNDVVHGGTRTDAATLRQVVARLDEIAALLRTYLNHDISEVYGSDDSRDPDPDPEPMHPEPEEPDA
jgi:uncharacterized protein YutE (UPF0331/DUF86 family)